MIKLEKDIYVRDQHCVRRRAFLAGQEVTPVEYAATLKDTVLNPEDLPEVEVPGINKSFHSKKMEYKVLEEEVVAAVVADEAVSEAPVEAEIASVEVVEEVKSEPAVEEAEQPKKKGTKK